ncbi:MAG: hypothetical protein WDO69_08850 [Pseudomonadota bacterium]
MTEARPWVGRLPRLLLTAAFVAACGANDPARLATIAAGSDGGSSVGGIGGAASAGGGAAGQPEFGLGGQHSASAGLGGDGPSERLTLDLNDVSFLYPLPHWEERDDLLSPSASGDQGVLLPRSVYEQIGLPLNSSTVQAPADIYSSLRVVGVRVDPCFPADAAVVPECLKQLRLVMQPVMQDPVTSELTTLDGTVHALYTLTDEQWQALVADLRALKAMAGTRTTGQPLTVHPVMASDGLRGPYATALSALVLKYAGESSLYEVALMLLLKSDRSWSFAAFVRLGATFVAKGIPTVDVQSEVAVVTFTTAVEGDAPHLLTLEPPPPGSQLLSMVNPLTSDDDAGAAVRAALIIENPTGSTNAQTVDCASCHLVSRNRSYAERTRGIDSSAWPERFRDDRFDLSRTDAIGDDARALRNFGYFGTKSALSQRTINESALVAAALSQTDTNAE